MPEQEDPKQPEWLRQSSVPSVPPVPPVPPEPVSPTEPEPLLPPSNDPTGQVFVEPDDAPPPATEIETDATARPSALRTATVVSGRVILGFVILAVVAVVIAAATLVRLPSVRASAVSTIVHPVATPEQLVCPGGLLRLGTSSGADATTASAIGSPEVASGAVPDDVLPRAFASSDANTGSGSGAPLLLTTPPVAAGAAPAQLSGAQSESVSTGDFSGLASSACLPASGSTWLVGGATQTGRTTLLLLANPTDVASSVDLQIYGESGQVSASGMDGIAVKAGSQRVLSIAGFAPGIQSPVVHVTSAGGQVVASLEQSTVRGLDPGGVDFVSGQNVPTTTAVIPGVVVTATAAISGDLGQTDYQDLQTALRLFVPSGKSTSVTITVLDESGTVTGSPTTANLGAGVVTDLPLDTLSDGKYTILVTAKIPVVASVRVSTVGSAKVNNTSDFAWVTAAPLLRANTLVAVAPDMDAVIHLDNPTSADETVRLRSLDGRSLTATVKANSATSVPVDAGTSYELEGFSALYASVSGTTDGGVTSYVVIPAAPAVGPLRVYG